MPDRQEQMKELPDGEHDPPLLQGLTPQKSMAAQVVKGLPAKKESDWFLFKNCDFKIMVICECGRPPEKSVINSIFGNCQQIWAILGRSMRASKRRKETKTRFCRRHVKINKSQ